MSDRGIKAIDRCRVVFDIIQGMDNIRTRQILDYVKARKSCTLKELMQKFRISSATIRPIAGLLGPAEAVTGDDGGVVIADDGAVVTARS